jgi:hypothetical protein
MLTRDELEGLYKKHRDARVLSAYVDGGQHDPAARRAWHTALRNGLDEQRRTLRERAPGEVEDFDAARGHIEAAVEGREAFVADRGWVGFATVDGLVYGNGVAVPMPDLVRWEGGIRVAPYVRALKQERVVVAAVADRRKARIFLYRDGTVEESAGLVSDQDHGDLGESSSSKRAATQSGSRGETGADRSQRARDVSAVRLQEQIVALLKEQAGSDGFIVLGGTTEVVSALSKQTEAFGDRRLERVSMSLDHTLAQVKSHMEEAASEITRRVQTRLLDQVVDAARSGGKGCLGIQATKEALREARVDTLLMSRTLMQRDPDLADHFVGAAFEQGALVEELSEDGATRLDAAGEGVAARLRYTT